MTIVPVTVCPFCSSFIVNGISLSPLRWATQSQVPVRGSSFDFFSSPKTKHAIVSTSTQTPTVALTHFISNSFRPVVLSRQYAQRDPNLEPLATNRQPLTPIR